MLSETRPALVLRRSGYRFVDRIVGIEVTRIATGVKKMYSRVGASDLWKSLHGQRWRYDWEKSQWVKFDSDNLQEVGR